MKAAFLLVALVFVAGCADPGDVAKSYLSGLDRDLTVDGVHELPCEGCVLVSLRSELHSYGVVVRGGRVVQATRDGAYDLLNARPVGSDEIVFFCGAERPDFCAAILDPVCADGARQMGSACEACKDSSVEWYVRGECASDYFKKVYGDLQAGRITKDSGPALVVVGWNIESTG